MYSIRGRVLLGVFVGLLAPGVSPAVRAETAAGEAVASIHPGDLNEAMTPRVQGTSVVRQLTGTERTGRWGVEATDLGHCFWHRGELYMVFGDTFGRGGLGGENWRSNTLARVSAERLPEGLEVVDMIAGPDGQAKELLPSLKVAGEEKTVIPTYAVSLGDRMVLHYMSVRRWGSGGRWTVGHAGLAYSDDDGGTWTKDPRAVWPGDGNFAQVAFVPHEGFVYVFGITQGRHGGVKLARVPKERLLDLEEYRYWDGAQWVEEEQAAMFVVPAPVGELSVRWDPTLGRWLTMYLNPERRAIVLRTSPELTGPWDEERVVVTAEEYPSLYAPYMIPDLDTGADVYFTMSQFRPYQVYLMRTTLDPGSEVVATTE